MAVTFDPAQHKKVSESTSPRFLDSVSNSNFSAKLTAAAATNTPQYWALSTDVIVNTAKTIPKNVVITPTGGKFTFAAGGSLTVEAPIVAPRVPLFSGFDSSNLKITKLTDAVFPEWFGAVGDNVTNDYAAFQLMFDSVQLGAGGGEGGDVKLASGKTYYIGSTLHVNRTCRVEGAGGTMRQTASKLRFPPNTKGIVFHSGSTRFEARGGSIAAGQNTLTANLNFTPADVGSLVTVYGAGTDAGLLVTPIVTVVNSTTVTLQASAAATVVPGDNLQIFKHTPYSASNSTLSNAALIGGGDSPAGTHNITISGQKITRVSGEGIDPFSGYPEGTTFQLGRGSYMIGFLPFVNHTATVTQGSRLVTIPAGGIDNSYEFAQFGQFSPYRIEQIVSATQFKLNRNWTGASGSGLSVDISKVGLKGVRFPVAINRDDIGPINVLRSDGYDFVEPYMVGATIRVNSKDYKIQSITEAGDTMTVTDMAGGAVTFQPGMRANGFITSLAPSAALTNVRVNFHTFHGIQMSAQMDVEKIYVEGFAGEGIHGDSVQNSGFPGGHPNLNNSQILRNNVWLNRSHGLYLRGTNANAMRIEGNRWLGNQGSGVYDISQHGNSYSGNETANNLQPIYTEGGLNNSTFTGEYVEGGGQTILSQKSMWIGGTKGHAAFDGEYSQGGVIATAETNKRGVLPVNGIATSSRSPILHGGFSSAITSMQIGQGDPAYPVLMAFGNSAETPNLLSPLNTYFLTYAENGTPAPHWYALQHGSPYRGGRSALAFSGALATEGANQVWAENGLYFGRGSGGFARAKLSTDSSSAIFDTNLKLPTMQLASGGGTGLTATPNNLGKFRYVPGAGGQVQVETLTILNSPAIGGDFHLYIYSSLFATIGPLFDFIGDNEPLAVQAEKVRALLKANATVTQYYTVGGTGANVTLTAVSASANDDNLRMQYKPGTSFSPLITESNSANTTAGVQSSADDTVQILVKKADGTYAWKNITLT